MGSSLLATDGYKFSMAEAGWPLRRETFYYSHRKGGLQVVPLDLEPTCAACCPSRAGATTPTWPATSYEMGAGFKAAIRAQGQAGHPRPPARARCFYPREPVFSLTGPSALVSWLEPLLLQLNFRIQVATQALADREALARGAGRGHLRGAEAHRPGDAGRGGREGRAHPRGRRGLPRAGARRVVRELVEAVEDPSRIFEVGLRAATCLEQHELALRACKEAGVTRTSNVYRARKLGMIPVGTMGHEHVQRYGSDEAAFRAMRERRPQRSSYLLDTYDTLTSGPARGLPPHRARSRAAGTPSASTRATRSCSTCYAVPRREGRGHPPGAHPRGRAGRAGHARVRGAAAPGGLGALARSSTATAATSSRAPWRAPSRATAWRPCTSCRSTGHVPTMKFGNELAEGKQSIPGVPVRLPAPRSGSGPHRPHRARRASRCPRATSCSPTAHAEAASLVAAQSAEAADQRVAYTPATQALVEELRRAPLPAGPRAPSPEAPGGRHAIAPSRASMTTQRVGTLYLERAAG